MLLKGFRQPNDPHSKRSALAFQPLQPNARNLSLEHALRTMALHNDLNPVRTSKEQSNGVQNLKTKMGGEVDSMGFGAYPWSRRFRHG